ncbi:hypothetical protein EYF80_067640 [Liparis tanakae]|uniref:Uncharacterized protein n=1 Tax=Liparis tanakae TaxID=230148 RepID=A0A4Z2E0C0_9TELE|nr:hypothetical protein EYF80_067640 [Liparis tanakae]
MQLQHMKHRLLDNQMSCLLVVRRENAASTHEAQTSIASIQPEESPPASCPSLSRSPCLRGGCWCRSSGRGTCSRRGGAMTAPWSTPSTKYAF